MLVVGVVLDEPPLKIFQPPNRKNRMTRIRIAIATHAPVLGERRSLLLSTMTVSFSFMVSPDVSISDEVSIGYGSSARSEIFHREQGFTKQCFFARIFRVIWASSSAG